LFDRLKVSNFTSKYQEYIEQFLDLKNPGKKISFTPPMIKGCFQRQFMVFHVDGKIYPCPTLACPERFPIGQFVPKAKIYMKKNKEYERISVSYLKKCRDCVMAFLCGGPCPARYCMRDRSINKILCMGQYEAEREVLRYLKRNVQALKKKISNFGAPFSAPDLILQKATSER
jgi:radical SAM protein with 4Fe4S-binding SPASM domain